MNERRFTTELMKSLDRYGFWAYKIPDTLGERFTLPKPFDIIAQYNGEAIAIECKQLRKWESFRKAHMRPHQIDHLDRFAVTDNGYAFVFLNIRIPNKENRLIILEWGEWKHRIMKGIKKDILAGLPYVGWISSRKVYDLRDFEQDIRDE